MKVPPLLRFANKSHFLKASTRNVFQKLKASLWSPSTAFTHPWRASQPLRSTEMMKGGASVFPGWKKNHTPPIKTWKWWFFDGFSKFGIWFRADLKRWNTWKLSEVYCVYSLDCGTKTNPSGCEGIYCLYATENSNISFRFLIYLYSHFSTIKNCYFIKKIMCKSCQISPSPCFKCTSYFLTYIYISYRCIYICYIQKKLSYLLFINRKTSSPAFCLKTPRCRPDGQRQQHVCGT